MRLSNATRRFQITTVAFAVVSLLACSKSNLSERDAKKEQLKSAAETKRKELALVAGLYEGTMVPTAGSELASNLKLEIKDIPTQVEGQVDPIMTPILTGYLRVEPGVPFSVSKADFDPKSGKLDLVLKDQHDNDVMFALRLKEKTILTGTWTAPASSTSGEATLNRVSNLGNVDQDLKGDYYGIVTHEKEGLYQYAQLTITTAVMPPQQLKVSGVLRLIYGEFESKEYLTYQIDPIQYNPMSGQLVVKQEGIPVSLTGFWSKSEFKGEWSSDFTGKIGSVHFKKGALPIPPAGQVAMALKGTYQGKLTSTNPQSNLPERMMVSFVTAQDLTKPNGITVSGSVRFYLGPFGSLEYVEYAFSDVQYNFFTHALTARVNDDYKLTLKGSADSSKSVPSISGTLSADALGEVGTFEVEKQ